MATYLTKYGLAPEIPALSIAIELISNRKKKARQRYHWRA